MPHVNGSDLTTCMIDDPGAVARELKDDILTIDYTDTQELDDITPVGNSQGKTRDELQQDLTCNIVCKYNTDANSTVDVFLKSIKGSRTAKLGYATNSFANFEFYITSAQPVRAQNGQLRINVQGQQAAPVTSRITTT